MLDNDRYIGLDQRRIIGVARYRRRVGQVVESEMKRSACLYRHEVRAERLAIGEEHCQRDVRIERRRVEKAGGLMAGHLWLRTMAAARYIAFSDRPSPPTDRLFASSFGHSRALLKRSNGGATRH